MVCTADDLLGWKDFPKGLKILLLDGDNTSAAEMRSKLEEMDYIVSIYSNEAEALSAISNKSECFHVAIIEVSTENVDGVIKFLETVKDLPTILVSNTHCLTTMMKCIALGAVEFLQKPLSDDKLRNIWQHVVHKAFNAGEKDVTESFKPVKAESMVSLLQLQLLNNEEDSNDLSIKNEALIKDHEMDTMLSGSDKLPAPSTPQLKRGEKLFDDSVCHDQDIFCGDHETGEQDGDSKSVETTSLNSIFESSKEPSNSRASTDAGLERASAAQDSFGTKANKKRTKVEWTPELHKKFVQAVEKLGVDQAIPSRILELMKVEGLTRHNVASHLQKYRLHRRHILPKDDNFRWANQPESARTHLPQQPIMAYPPSYYPHHNHLPQGQVHHPTWIPPHSNYSNGMMTWGSPYYPTWQLPTESWQWNPYSGLNADVWGCPVIPPTHGQYLQVPQAMPRSSESFNGGQNPYNGSTLVNLSDLHPAEDEIDKIVQEAISKPWLPLPLGLKPPSTDSVLNELTKQGISTVPPPHPKGGPHTC